MDLEQQLANHVNQLQSPTDIQNLVALINGTLKNIYGREPQANTKERFIVDAVVRLLNLIGYDGFNATSPDKDDILVATRDALVYLDSATKIAKGLVKVSFDMWDSRADELFEFRTGLRKACIQFEIESPYLLWVPTWVDSALKAYRSSDGFAGLKFWRYLKKMRPSIDDYQDKHVECKNKSKKNLRRKIRNKQPQLK